MVSMLQFQCAVVVLFLFLLPSSGAADEGRIELNQASVASSGGFPYTISEPGSYVLTGNLTVSPDTDALVVAAEDVDLDLNGFAIVGPFTCTAVSCAEGLGNAVNALRMDRVTVRNGNVRGFGHSCIVLGDMAGAKDLVVSNCGRNGIVVSFGSLVLRNRIGFTGREGVVHSGTSHPSAFSQNTVRKAGLGGGAYMAVKGVLATGGNTCDDNSCSPRTPQRYYLSQAAYPGSDALVGCEAGFHMASFWEIQDLGNLRYDTTLGFAQSDSGSGPPALGIGWARSGWASSVVATPGRANCNVWTSDSNMDNGSYAAVPGDWAASGASSSPWQVGVLSCSLSVQVWCIED